MKEPEIPTEIIVLLMAVLFAALVAITYGAYRDYPNKTNHFWRVQ